MSRSSSRPLFGGALTATLPSNVIDASDLRQIPDTQEVFLFPDSDASIIFEILQIVEEGEAKDDLREAVKYHYNSIAHDNTALSSSIDSVSSPFPLPSSAASLASDSSDSQHQHFYTTLEGVQIVSKFNRPASEADSVKLFLGLIRVDLGPRSQQNGASAKSEQAGSRRGADITICVNVPLGKTSEVDAGRIEDGNRDLEVKAKQWFQDIVASFKVVDYGLFA